MNVTVKWSVILAVVVTVLSAVVLLTGQHTSPLVGGMGSIVAAIAINLVVIYLALKETADNPYGKQLSAGASIGAIAGLLILVSSWLMLSFVFPDSIDEMREGYLTWMESTGMPQAQLDQQAQRLEQATPFSQAWPGLLGTFGTSVIGAAVIGFFVRSK